MVRNSTESLVRVALLWVLVGAMAAPARAGPIPQPLLQAVRARAAVAYRGEQIVVAWEGAAKAQASLVRIEHDPPAWTRLDYVPLGPSLRWTVIRRDTVEIRFDPLRLTGTTGPRASTDEDAFETVHLPWLLENYRIATAQDALLGRKVTRVELVPAAGDRPTHRLTVDDETGVVLRSERIGPDGSLGEVTAFLQFEIMPVGWRRNATMPAGRHHLGAAAGPAHAGALVACGPGADDGGRSLACRPAGCGGAHRGRVRSANLGSPAGLAAGTRSFILVMARGDVRPRTG